MQVLMITDLLSNWNKNNRDVALDLLAVCQKRPSITGWDQWEEDIMIYEKKLHWKAVKHNTLKLEVSFAIEKAISHTQYNRYLLL